jgi:hypothetical protein
VDELLTGERPIVLRRTLLALGFDDHEVRRAVRAGRLARVRHGAYTSGEVWRAADEEERHRLRGLAVLETHPEVVLSHISAALHHGLRVWNAPLDQVHVTRTDMLTSRRMGDVVHHVGELPDAEEMPDRCVDVVRAAVETASLLDVERAVVVLDSLLHLGFATEEQMIAAYEQRSRWPHSRKLQVAVRFARRGSQSVGESRLRWLCYVFGLPAPELQVPITGADGTTYYVDLAWPGQRVIVEFDGKVKYADPPAGRTAADVLFREKRREDMLREATGWQVLRVTWWDLEHPQLLVARLRKALGLAAA